MYRVLPPLAPGASASTGSLEPVAMAVQVLPPSVDRESPPPALLLPAYRVVACDGSKATAAIVFVLKSVSTLAQFAPASVDLYSPLFTTAAKTTLAFSGLGASANTLAVAVLVAEALGSPVSILVQVLPLSGD